MQLPLRDAVLNSAALDTDADDAGEGGEAKQGAMGGGAEYPGERDKYDGVGRWYKLVTGSSNGATTTSSSGTGKKSKKIEDDTDHHETEAEYILVNLLYHTVFTRRLYVCMCGRGGKKLPALTDGMTPLDTATNPAPPANAYKPPSFSPAHTCPCAHFHAAAPAPAQGPCPSTRC